MSNLKNLPTAEQIRKEARIECARLCFWDFCNYYDNTFFLKRLFLKDIADGFQKIYIGEIKTLSVSLPPRAGKSYITTLFIAWFLGNRPQESVMRNTCTATLYDKFSYDTRNVLRTDKFKKIFSAAQLAEDKQNISGWNLKQSKQVGYFGAGVGGTIIGFGASGVAITDDLYKSLDDALSSGTNEKVHRWKESVHDSRLEKNCPTIDIGTRWTKQDIIGKGIKEKKYDVSIIVPALINERSFCEDVKTTEEYIKIRSNVASEIWNGEYLQQPIEIEGLLFYRTDLKRFSIKDYKPIGKESTLGYADIADEGDDFFSMPMADIFQKKVFITDILFTKENIDVTLPLTAGLIKKKEANYIRVESNNQGSVFIKMLRDLVPREKILKVTNTSNKHTRILMEYGFIKEYFYFLDDNEIIPGSDYDKFMRQLLTYNKDGSSKHDDASDSISGLAKFIQGLLPHLFSNGLQ